MAVQFWVFPPYPPLRVVSMPLSIFLGLKDRNPAGRWFSYLFKLLVIIQPSLTHFCLFLFFPHTLSSPVSEEVNLSLKRSERTLSIFLTRTCFQSTFPFLSSVQSLEGKWCPGAW